MNAADRTTANLDIIGDRGYTNYDAVSYPFIVCPKNGQLSFTTSGLGSDGVEITFVPSYDCVEENHTIERNNPEAICNVILGNIAGTDFLISFNGFYYHGDGLASGSTNSFCSAAKLLAGHRYKWVISYPDKDNYHCKLTTDDDVLIDEWNAEITDIALGNPVFHLGYPINAHLAASYDPEGYYPPQEFTIINVRVL
jgi:hypothetical protein